MKDDKKEPAPDKFQLPPDGIEWVKPPKSAEVAKRAKVNRVRKLLSKIKPKK